MKNKFGKYEVYLFDKQMDPKVFAEMLKGFRKPLVTEIDDTGCDQLGVLVVEEDEFDVSSQQMVEIIYHHWCYERMVRDNS